MRATIAIVAALAFAVGAPVSATPDGAKTPTCFEDQVMAWQGSTKQHAVCVNVDDPGLRDAIANAGRQ